MQATRNRAGRAPSLLAVTATVGAACAWAAAGAALAESDAQRTGESGTWCRAFARRWVERHHVDPRHVEVESLCTQVAERAESGRSDGEIGRWLEQELEVSIFGFAPEDAKPDPSARYRLPFETWIPRLASQGPGGPTHDTPRDRDAWDFLLPIGAPVLAARAGVVARVLDGSHVRNGPLQGGDLGNAVLLLHPDGVYSSYLHLEPGIPVEEGQKVAAGALLGYAGNTGASSAPHLHFVVARRVGRTDERSVPVRFGAPRSPGWVPEEGRHVGAFPKSRRPLRVVLDGKTAAPDQPVAIRAGSGMPMRVEVQEADGSWRDVTASERTRVESLTLWNVSPPAPDRIAAVPTPGFDESALADYRASDTGEGIVAVYHGRPRDPDFAWTKVALRVVP